MGRMDRESGEIHAKIVYYGPKGAGTTTNARLIHQKLKRQHRGELRVAYANKKAESGPYEFLPVRLGSVRGFETSIHVHTVPGGAENAAERCRVLEGADGIVFVADLRPERHEATLEALHELEEHLATYDRKLGDVLTVLQYNRRDQADETHLEKLHARLGIAPEAHFEAIASEGTGVLQCLTTLSKAILSQLRRKAEEPEPPAPVRGEDTTIEADVSPMIEIQPELLDGPSEGMYVEASGPVSQTDSGLRIPLRFVDDESGKKIELSLLVSIER